MKITVHVTRQELLDKGAQRGCNGLNIFDKAHPDGVWHIDNWTLDDSLRIATERRGYAKWLIVRGIIPPIAAYQANLEGANLEGGNLYNANLYNANLYNAYLERANLEDANLKYADLEGAKYNKNTRFPDGFDPEKAGMIFVE